MNVVEVPYKPQKGTLTRRNILKRKSTRTKSKAPLRGKQKPKTYSKLLKEADAIFSRYVRISNANQDGMVQCFTCPYKAHYKKLQNGHYISRFYKKYRFDQRNTRPQCAMCNMWKSGDIPTFRANLVKELGIHEVHAMESDYKELHKLDKSFLEATIETYTVKLDCFLTLSNKA